jgi:hypothetical protein
MNLEVFCGGYIGLAVGGMTNQPEGGLFLLVREGSHLAISPFGEKLWLDRCHGDLKRGGGITTAEGLCGLGKQAVHLQELYSGIC